MYRLVVLGSGGAIPSPDRNVSCVGIRIDGRVYIFDACEGMQRQMMRYGLSYSKVRTIFLSHLHPDHYLGIPGLVYTLQLSDFDGTLDIIGPKGTRSIVESLLIGDVPEFVHVREFSDECVVYDEGNFTVRSFRVKHSGNSYGFVLEQKPTLKFYKERANALGISGRMFREIEKNGKVEVGGKIVKLEEVSWIKKGVKIIYTGDTVYDENVARNSEDADLLIHDATFLESERKDADEKMHATAKDAATIAHIARCKRLLLTHISNRYRDDKGHYEEANVIFPEVIVAKDGMEILI
ncbi:MAG: ribonuclease Z [Candidatus Micrarchaeia archaeon]